MVFSIISNFEYLIINKKWTQINQNNNNKSSCEQLTCKQMAVLHNNANRDLHLIWKIYYYELVTVMDIGSEMLSVDHANIS
jgi:hypothetical protein